MHGLGQMTLCFTFYLGHCYITVQLFIMVKPTAFVINLRAVFSVPAQVTENQPPKAIIISLVILLFLLFIVKNVYTPRNNS